MKGLSKGQKVLVIALLFTLCVFSGRALAAYKDEYKLDLVPNIQTAWGQGAQYFCDLVKERSGGKINIRPYFSSQLTAGKQTASMLLLRNGAIDFALQGVFNWAPQMPEFNLFALPFFMNTYEEIDAVKNGKAGKIIQDILESKGVHFLAWGENGYRAITNSKREIHVPDDLVGMKVRVVGSPLILDTFRAMGANPVNMNWNDVMSAVQQGVIDGQENPFNYFYVYKIQQYHPYISDWHYTCDALMYCVNPGVWKSFSPEDQKLIKDCAEEAGKFEMAMARVGLDDGSALKYLESIGKVPELKDYYGAIQAEGAKVVRLSDDEVRQFVEKTQSVRDSWKDKIGKELYEAAEEDMKSVRK
ncbi:MAG: DctP family TRAP transporter solute-binding subunit [Synergistaceae bacterium]|jgi:tripartite ATP-independent transporter DctP family solute receptor|nr:DctP family TRAP transporter solute-binding subunit [Synergistaceae bacterium]